MADIVVVGAGIGGMAAAVTAASRGLDVVLLEKGARVGGAAAYSGGQVWVGGNHVAEPEGLADSAADTLAYVAAAASRDEASLDRHLAAQWIEGAAAAARFFEDAGVISWEVIPGYPDYYHSDRPGSRAAGRYLTGAPFDGTRLGDQREKLLVSPHFPVGITYAEMFEWGGMSSKTEWDWDLVARRRADDVLTFGTGIAAAFFRGVLDSRVDVRTEHEVVGLVSDGGTVVGARLRTRHQPVGPQVPRRRQAPAEPQRRAGVGGAVLRDADAAAQHRHRRGGGAHRRQRGRPRRGGRVVDGLYAAGECSARAAAGVGYNSGYSLSRAMAYGFLAATAIADSRS